MPKKRVQVLFIHGGMTFKNQKDYSRYLKTRPISLEKKVRWHHDYLTKELGSRFEIIRLKMPLAENAQYADWKIHFERYFPFLRNNLILVGSSLGGTFLAKYLSEQKFPKKILSTYLICTPFDNSLLGEDLVGGFKLKSDLSQIEKNSPNLHLLFSKDDDVVPLAHAKKFRQKLKKAQIIIYENKNGHFKISSFPEMIKMIKEDIQNKQKRGDLKMACKSCKAKKKVKKKK